MGTFASCWDYTNWEPMWKPAVSPPHVGFHKHLRTMASKKLVYMHVFFCSTREWNIRWVQTTTSHSHSPCPRCEQKGSGNPRKLNLDPPFQFISINNKEPSLPASHPKLGSPTGRPGMPKIVARALHGRTLQIKASFQKQQQKNGRRVIGGEPIRVLL